VNLATITAIRSELESALKGKRFGKVYALSRLQFAVDFRLPDSQYLFISIEPSSPRIYLIRRRLRDIEKQASSNPTAFVIFIQKRLAGAKLTAIDQIEDERVLILKLDCRDDLGNDNTYSLAVQLTGRSSNFFLLNAAERILESARGTAGLGQQPGDVYAPPLRTSPRSFSKTDYVETAQAGLSLSQVLDRAYLESDHTARVNNLANAARKKISKELGKIERLKAKLDADLASHGDANKWKRLGDLLLANAGAPKREGNNFAVIDYYDENLPEIAVETEEGSNITEAAETFFKRYAKARNAAEEVARRKIELDAEIARVEQRQALLEAAIAAEDEAVIEEFAGERPARPLKKSRSANQEITAFARTFSSSDGFEILVGKKAKDNDHLTFRVAKSLDLWMHAADYPGSHVVVRNPNRKEIPPSTLLEAAQLAAFYSQGKTQTKAAVHYTQKKFVNKPRGAAPGLVSLSSFKTILVVPKVPDLVVLSAA